MKLRCRDYRESKEMEGNDLEYPINIENMEPGQSTPVGSVEIDDSLENSQEKDVEEGSRQEPSYQGTSSSRENPESLNVDLFKSLLECIQWQIN